MFVSLLSDPQTWKRLPNPAIDELLSRLSDEWSHKKIPSLFLFIFICPFCRRSKGFKSWRAKVEIWYCKYIFKIPETDLTDFNEIFLRLYVTVARMLLATTFGCTTSLSVVEKKLSHLTPSSKLFSYFLQQQCVHTLELMLHNRRMQPVF